MDDHEKMEDLKEELKDAIRHFFFEDELAIRDVIDIAARIKKQLIPDEEISLQETEAHKDKEVGIHEEIIMISPTAESFVEYCKTTKMTYSYKMLLISAFMKKADASGCMKIDDAVNFFRDYYEKRRELGRDIEKANCIYMNPDVTDDQIRKNLIMNPIRVLDSSEFFSYNKTEKVLKMEPETWSTLDDKTKETVFDICQQRLKDYYQD